MRDDPDSFCSLVDHCVICNLKPNYMTNFEELVDYVVRNVRRKHILGGNLVSTQMSQKYGLLVHHSSDMVATSKHFVKPVARGPEKSNEPGRAHGLRDVPILAAVASPIFSNRRKANQSTWKQLATQLHAAAAVLSRNIFGCSKHISSTTFVASPPTPWDRATAQGEWHMISDPTSSITKIHPYCCIRDSTEHTVQRTGNPA